jgi:putative flippase GtrA
MTAIVARLPFGLAGLVSPRLAGFLVISTVTFTIDLALLTAIHGGLGWPLPVSITVSYTAASALGFLANRVLNFRSHGAVGPQAARYAVVIAINYLGCILGVTDALAALGTDYRLARIAAAAVEAAYMYAALRWVVFRDAASRDPSS